MSSMKTPLLQVDVEAATSGAVSRVARPGRLLERRTSRKQYHVTFPPLLFIPSCTVISFLMVLGGLLALCLTAWKEPLERWGLTSGELLKYVSIPVVSTVFTYVHIWAALYMTFYPLRFVGCCQIKGTNVGLCGWQGIVPSKAESMARRAVDMMTKKIINAKEVLGRIDPNMVAHELGPVLDTTLAAIMEEVALSEEPSIWLSLSQGVKDELVAKAREESPAAISAMMQDVKENIDTVFDLTEMVVTAFTREPELLNLMFIDCGYDELKFIRDCGATMGAFFGTIQVGLWIFYSAGWMLPAFGLVVGMASNWFALKMIFEPVEPVDLCCGIKLQGLFLKRQAAVSARYAEIVSAHVLSAKYLIPAILTGPCATALYDVLNKHFSQAFDNYAGGNYGKRTIQSFRGKDKYVGMKNKVNSLLLDSLPDLCKHLEKKFDKDMDLATLLRTRMAALPASDFEQLLHPVFQEDEWKLVLMGGVLGVVIGCVQWFALGS